MEFKSAHEERLNLTFCVFCRYSQWKCASYVNRMSTKRSIHLANLGLIVFIVHYRADKLNLGEETQCEMALLVKFRKRGKNAYLPTLTLTFTHTQTDRYKSAYV